MNVRTGAAADFYQVLGIEKTSTQEEIKKAYRKVGLCDFI
jgi:DnaJ-class molecular chaperone